MQELFSSKRISSNLPGGTTPAFSCPFCKGIASHDWRAGFSHKIESSIELSNVVVIAKCQACSETSIWLKNEHPMTKEEKNFEILLYPRTSTIDVQPNPDMPSNVREVFDEASLILDDSPRASAALSRLAIELLMDELKAEGRNLNDKIGYLVTQGLPVSIQQALDTVRVIGNNAVHPGEINMSDNKEMAITLLKFINIIVQNQISEPKSIKEAYSSLPEGAIKGIEQRDRQK